MTTAPRLEEKKEISRASLILAFFTFISRLLGLVRNQILSHFFGAGFVADAFIAAFTIPNALRRLFGEGALTPSIVSTLTRHLKADLHGESWRSYLSSLFVWLTIILTGISALGIYFSPQLVSLYVPEFYLVPSKLELTITLTRFLFIFILFVGWSAFFMGILNTFRSFGISAFVPALNSLAVIAIVPLGILFFHPPAEHGIFIYAGAMLLGAAAQVAFQIPYLRSVNAMPFTKFKFKDPRVFELGRLLVPSFFSMAIYQINIIVNRIFASQIDGGVSHLFYADLIIELPVALIATSIGTAVIPSFSRLITEKNNFELIKILQFSLRSVWILALPCCGGLLMLSTPIISTLYFSGRFTIEDSSETSKALLAYACGLPFFATLRIFLAYFFADKNTRAPFWAGFFALFVNAILAWQLAPKFGVMGIAFATSISSFANLFVLLILLIVTKGPHPFRGLQTGLTQIISATLGMMICLYTALQAFSDETWTQSGINFVKIFSLSSLLIIGISSFLSFSWILKVPLMRESIKAFVKRLRIVLKISIKS